MATHWHPKQELESLGATRTQPPKRAARVADVIKNELSVLLLQKVRDPQLQDITISRVELSDDLRHAKVYFTMFEGQTKMAQVTRSLQKATGFMRSHLAKTLNLRFTPELRFWYDEEFEEVKKIERLLDDIARDRDERQEDS
ncbi:MAG: 30S ribosome-binding factor RbfA [Desulfofustis sp.]|jgi:ribosome-binding factor A